VHSLQLNRQSYQWIFLRAEVRFPILRIDFLRHFDLLVDVAREQLIPRSSLWQAPPPPRPALYATCGTASSIAPPAAAGSTPPSQSPPSWADILAEFPSVTKSFADSIPPTHGVEHHIITERRPATAKFRRLDTAKLAAAKEEFNKMLAAGIIRRSSS
jgi:hypothetical protein